MGHLNGTALTRFEKGQPLKAAALNDNFAALTAALEGLALEARTPDPAVIPLELRTSSLETKVAALEHLTSMHARQRNEKEWAPLAHIGALVQMVNDLRRDLERETTTLSEIAVQLLTERRDHERRLHRLEQQPEYARQEEFAPLKADHDRLALKEHMLLAQVIALRHETGLLRDMTMAKDRQANRLEFAPMSYIGHILQRLQALEAKL